ncbi:MAG: hypothetical protein HZA01_08735 [Nitrospinae bacterium]|nr:hypothetical protein [Nitrospinota bacterium]
MKGKDLEVRLRNKLNFHFGFVFLSLAGFIFISGLAGPTTRFAEGKIK